MIVRHVQICSADAQHHQLLQVVVRCGQDPLLLHRWAHVQDPPTGRGQRRHRASQRPGRQPRTSRKERAFIAHMPPRAYVVRRNLQTIGHISYSSLLRGSVFLDFSCAQLAVCTVSCFVANKWLNLCSRPLPGAHGVVPRYDQRDGRRLRCSSRARRSLGDGAAGRSLFHTHSHHFNFTSPDF